MHVGPMFSDALGSVKITSADPRVKPALRFNFSTEQDRREWPEAIRCARTILGQPAFAPFDGGEVSPGPEVESDEEILDWVARDAETFHPSARAGWAIDDRVSSTRRRCGSTARRLRVVDASVMPSITNANLYAPTMMIAEKAAGPDPRRDAARALDRALASARPDAHGRRDVTTPTGKSAPPPGGRSTSGRTRRTGR